MGNASLIKQINATPFSGRRRLVAIVGPPASGKSTLAEQLAEQCENACVVPMDGFHLSNDLLDAHGLRARKGAPETFDANGFLHLVRRLKAEGDVIYPLFDRGLDISINAAGTIAPEIETVIVEGNYLLLDQDIWRALADHWDLSVQLRVPQEILTERLISRWRIHGLSDQAARDRALSNDVPNAKTVMENSLSADIYVDSA